MDFYPTSYLYDPNGEIVMFIPGQVKLRNIHAFVASWNRKNLGVAADPPAASADVKEVDFSKPKPAAPPQRTRRTTTY